MRHTTRNTLTPTIVLGLVLLLAVVLAACGTGSSDAESTEQTVSTVAETTTTTSGSDDDHDHDHDHDEDDDHDHDHDEDHGDKDSDAAADGAVELDDPRRLLVVAALDEAVIDLIDLDDESVTSVELDAIASVGSSLTESGRYLLAGHEDAVTVVDTGVWSEGHGTHKHHYTTAPSVLGQVEGPSPTHLISHHGRSALYFDGTGSALVIDETALDSGEVVVVAEVPTAEPHHGFALPTHDDYFVTVPTDDMEGLPNVVGISTTDGEVQAQFDCPVTHGEASLDGAVASACVDGVALIVEDGESWTGSYLPYPDIDDEDPFGFGPARAWFLRTDAGGSLLAAPHGSQHVLVVDAVAGESQSFDLGLAIGTFGVIFLDDGRLIVLTQDGFLHLVDPADGSVLASLEVIPPFQEGDEDEPWRQVAVTGDHVYVTDPGSNQVVEVAVSDVLTLERTIGLGFTPGYLAIANG